jgi:hypothetical protein
MKRDGNTYSQHAIHDHFLRGGVSILPLHQIQTVPAHVDRANPGLRARDGYMAVNIRLATADRREMITAIEEHIYADREFAYDEPRISMEHTAIIDGAKRQISFEKFVDLKEQGIPCTTFWVQSVAADGWQQTTEVEILPVKAVGGVS